MHRSSSNSPGSGKHKAHAAPRLQHSGEFKEGLGPGLYLTATPIGNAQDITLRALRVLRECDLIAAEDTRVTAKLLAIHGLANKLSPYNDHNGARERPRLLKFLRDGARIALVSDAGTPLVSDPGFKLVRAAIGEGLAVHAVPGPSAALAGLLLSGLPTDRFLFAGFLPARGGERRTALEDLKSVPATLIVFETGPRLCECLKDMAQVLGERDAAVAREMTKLHEEVRRDTLPRLLAGFAAEAPPKGEVTVLVASPRAEAAADFTVVDRALDQALAFMPLKPASELIAGLLGISRHGVYARGLEKKNG